MINRPLAVIDKPLELYLDLLKRTLTRVAFLDEEGARHYATGSVGSLDPAG
jgi:hypothetical protein